MNISLSNWWSWGILLLLLMIVAVVDSRKRIPRKTSIFILVPLLSVVIIFMMSENNKEAEQSFHTLEEAVTAYGKKVSAPDRRFLHAQIVVRRQKGIRPKRLLR